MIRKRKDNQDGFIKLLIEKVPHVKQERMGFEGGREAPTPLIAASRRLRHSVVVLLFARNAYINAKVDGEDHYILLQVLVITFIPKTIQEAILVTRRLGICYLWVDTLHIIQDSREDWLGKQRTYPDGIPKDRDPSFERQHFAGLKMYMIRNGQGVAKERMHLLWQDMVSLQSKRKLTFQTDRPVALAGAANQAARIFDNTFISGLWTKRLCRDLPWRVEGNVDSSNPLFVR